MKIIIASALWLILFLVPVSAAEDCEHASSHHAADTNVAANLPPQIRQMLTREMQALQTGMQTIIPAIATGDWETLESTGKQIHDSYLMKQNLSPEQLEKLHNLLPREFVAADHDFHHAAGRLAHAAKARDMELVRFFYANMTGACAACHARFAPSRFPGLREKSSVGQHH